jgi:hypothetical protein
LAVLGCKKGYQQEGADYTVWVFSRL